MKQIKLDVEEDKVEIVLNIIKNLKEGLISNIEVDGITKQTLTKYQPKHNRVIYENENPQGKYMSPLAYKLKLDNKN